MAGTVEIDKREIRVDGNPVQILSGAMDYFLIHPDFHACIDLLYSTQAESRL